MTHFRVSEVPLTSKDGTYMGMEKYKALVRDDTEECLSIVGADYRVLQNDDVFGAIEDKIVEAVGKKAMDSARIVSDEIKGGQTCTRSYTFPSIRVPSTKQSRSDINFRIIGINGFGGRSVKVLYGGIDQFCLNGMIVGENINEIMFRHTKNQVVSQNVNPIGDVLESFKISGKRWVNWQKTDCSESMAEDLVKASFSLSLSMALLKRFAAEAAIRGMTVWALYSALTYYASHDSAEFPISTVAVRNRNEGGTLLDRSQRVANVVNSPEWFDHIGV